MSAPTVLLLSGGGVLVVGGAGLGYWLYKRHQAATEAMPPGVIGYSATKPAALIAAPMQIVVPATVHPAIAKQVSTLLATHPAISASALASFRMMPKTAPAPKPAAALVYHSGYDTLSAGESLKVGDARVSKSNVLAVLFEPGTLNLYDIRGGKRNLLWSTGNHPGADHVTMQQDGNFVMYDANNKPLWDTETWPGGGCHMMVMDDGNMGVGCGNTPYWDTNTSGFVNQTSKGGNGKTYSHGFNIGELAAIAIGVPPGVFTAIVTVSPDTDQWTRNAIKTAGRSIESAAHDIQDVSGEISAALASIPIVGPLLHGLYDSTFMVTLGPLMMTEQVVVEGQGIDQVALAELQSQLQDFKEVGPYAEMVCSLIPGVGSGIAAAIGVGLALANGQGIAEAILAGVEAAVPGGPLAKMAFDVAQKSIVAAVEGKPLNWGLVASTGVEVLADVVDIPVPDAVKKMIEGGMTCAALLVQGKPLSGAVVSGFAAALPVDDGVKAAIAGVASISVDLASGKRLDAATLAAVQSAARMLPVDTATKQGLTAGIAPGASAMHGEFGDDIFGADLGPAPSSEFVLAQRIRQTVTDIFLNRGKAGLNNKKAADAINIAIGMQQGRIIQQKAASQFVVGGPVMTQLLAKGRMLLQTDSVVAAAYKALPSGQTGFLVGVAVMRYQCNAHQFLALRDNLSGPDKQGYDTGVSLHIGRVATPVPSFGDRGANTAAYFAARGLQGAKPQQKVQIVQALVANPATKTGTAQAVKAIHANSGVIPRLMHTIGLR